MGVLTVTIQNLEVISIDKENNCILVKGNVPGPKKSLVMIRTSVKNPGKINEVDELISYEVIETPEVTEEVNDVESETTIVEQTEETNETESVSEEV